MPSLSEELIDSSEAIVQRWYEAWSRSSHHHRELSEALLKNNLAKQLRFLGKQSKNLQSAEEPERMWKFEHRLDPELRIEQNIPIEELVQEYCMAVDVVRDWVEDRNIEVPFHEYSYFYRALFELTAEAVRRYNIREAEETTAERAKYLAGLAHQMRGPLSSVALLIDQAKRSAVSGHEVIAEVIELSDRNLKRLVSLIEKVLKLERFKPEEIAVHPQLTVPVDNIANILSDNDHDAAEKVCVLKMWSIRL